MRANDLSRHARQVMTVAEGKAPAGAPGADPSIARSWMRCLEQYHLDPAQPMAPAVLEHARMLEVRERHRQVLEIASGEMNSLHQQLSGAGHAVLLTDSRGVILNCVSEAAERRTFEQAGLWLGADWSEAREGTNGIGTCLVERQALTIHQDEHFRSRHTGLTCSASPVFDPQGELLAVLDVSSARRDVSRQSQFHTMALVNLSAKAIESCYFLRHFEDQWLLRFHLQPDGLGLFSEGMLAFGADGRIRAANQSAINLLGSRRESLIGRSLDQFFECRLDDLFGRADPQPNASWPLRTHAGRTLYALLRGKRPIAAAPVLPRAPLAKGLCIDDAQLAHDFRRALKVYAHDVPLLLQGETGTGKEAFARAVHLGGERAGKSFVALNCAAIPETLIESELFGYRGGSFTGARKEGMRGKLQQADGGTLFLDEIGDMPLALQARLLRVLQERKVAPLGAGEEQDIDVALICATHRDLKRLVEEKHFREDLYYRVNGISVKLPALRERDDLAELAGGLLARLGAPKVKLSAELLGLLREYHWPGNIRQLEMVLRTALAMREEGEEELGLDHLPDSTLDELAAGERPQSGSIRENELELIRQALERHQGNVSAAADALGISRATLYRKLKQLKVG